MWHYEICPWPHRVFEGTYPKYQPNIARKDETAFEMETSKPSPPSYATWLSSMFQLFGDMDQPEFSYEDGIRGVGVLMSDSSMFQRTFPDGVVTGRKLSDLDGFDAEAIKQDDSLLKDFAHGAAFPQFFGLAMPLLKWGLPVVPVQLDNVLRFENYLAENKFLVLSYEFIKPTAPEVNEELVKWVKNGGTLFYVGDGSDPYHQVKFWWQQAGYDTPARHLMDLAGLGIDPEDGTYPVERGRIVVWNKMPAAICLDKASSDDYRERVRSALAECGIEWVYRNDLTLRRGPYIISSVMNQSVSENSKVFEGRFVDLLENDYPIITRKEVKPDECTILLDLDKVADEPFRVLGTAARVLSAEQKEEGLVLALKSASPIRTYTRLRLPKKMEVAQASTGVEATWDEASSSLLLCYDSVGDEITVTLQ